MITLIVFILTISVIVLVHELGHYCFARLFNVKIITFSIGFGPKLFSFNTKYNEWKLCLIPLGGYVQMLDTRVCNISNEDLSKSFDHQNNLKKIIIAAAGCLFNFIFAFMLYYFIGLYGIPALKPIIVSVNNESNTVNFAIKPNSIIKKIDGISVNSWDTANEVFSNELKKSLLISFEIEYQHKIYHHKFDISKQKYINISDLTLESLGFFPYSFIPIISEVSSQNSKFQINDKILAINNVYYNNWFDIVNFIRSNPNKLVVFKVLRKNKIINLNILINDMRRYGKIIGKIGILGTINIKELTDNTIKLKYNPLSAIVIAGSLFTSVIKINVINIYMLFIGKVSYHEIGGPISIAKTSYSAISNSIIDYLGLIALLSICIGFANLLPIPMLDGGHIIMYFFEAITRRKLTLNIQLMLLKFGFIVILCLFILAIYNDILRL